MPYAPVHFINFTFFITKHLAKEEIESIGKVTSFHFISSQILFLEYFIWGGFFFKGGVEWMGVCGWIFAVCGVIVKSFF